MGVEFTHSEAETYQVITITPIAALENNYFWVIRPDIRQPFVYLVDPGDAAPVIGYLQKHELQPKAILVTHRHHDHIDGINELLQHWPVPVFGPDSPAISQVTHKLKDGDRLKLPPLEFHVIGVPGHTVEHIAYYLPVTNQSGNTAPKLPAIFCGDALFAAGCGRMFDGPADVMWASLCRLAALPDNTQVYCAHEYTLVNLAFAKAVEPDNPEIAARYEAIKILRSNNGISLPTNILLEKRTNPFLRCQESGIKNFICNRENRVVKDEVEIFALLRKAKDNWPQR